MNGRMHDAATTLALNVHVHIDRIVIDGSAPATQRDIEAAVAAELTRALAQHPLPAVLRHGGDVTDNTGTVDPRLPIGDRIGSAIFTSLSTAPTGRRHA